MPSIDSWLRNGGSVCHHDPGVYQLLGCCAHTLQTENDNNCSMALRAGYPIPLQRIRKDTHLHCVVAGASVPSTQQGPSVHCGRRKHRDSI